MSPEKQYDLENVIYQEANALSFALDNLEQQFQPEQQKLRGTNYTQRSNPNLVEEWVESADWASIQEVLLLAGQPPARFSAEEVAFWEIGAGKLIERVLENHPGLKDSVVEHVVSALQTNSSSRFAHLVVLDRMEARGIENRLEFLIDQVPTFKPEEAEYLFSVLAFDRSPEGWQRMERLQALLPDDWTCKGWVESYFEYEEPEEIEDFEPEFGRDQ